MTERSVGANLGNRPPTWRSSTQAGGFARTSTSPGLAPQVVSRFEGRNTPWQLDREGVGGYTPAPPVQHTADDLTCPACKLEKEARR